MHEYCPLKQVFPLIKFIEPSTLVKSFMVLSRGWALKLSTVIKLSYELEKKSIIWTQSLILYQMLTFEGGLDLRKIQSDGFVRVLPHQLER